VEADLHVAEERGVEIDAPVVRAVERAHRRLRLAAAARLAAGEEAQLRRPVGLAALLEHIAPDVLGVAEHGGDELAGPVARRASFARGLLVGLLIGATATVEHLGAADQNARVDAERVTDDAEHDDRADAQATAADRQAEAAPANTPAAAVVLDIVAAAEIVPTHSSASRCRRPICGLWCNAGSEVWLPAARYHIVSQCLIW